MQDIQTTNVEKALRQALEIEIALYKCKERRPDSAKQTNKATAQKKQYGKAWKQEYASW